MFQEQTGELMGQQPKQQGFQMRAFKMAAAITTPLAALASGAVTAGEFCVTCSGPDAHYACAFDGVSADTGDPRLKLLCITELAKSGGHASCSVDRKQIVPCPGEAKRLAMPEGFDLAPTPAAGTPQAQPPATPQPVAGDVPPPMPAPKGAPAPKSETTIEKSAGPAPEAPPKTVQEMVEKGSKATGEAFEKSGEAAGNAVKSTGSVLEKAGKAAGDAAKKTWNCITSLFGDC
ncbi:MAG: hypothetical protein HOP09_16995 [Hyphomicrobium sp.]|nr:hypothetical protein [Hyphomicrobium sp.]